MQEEKVNRNIILRKKIKSDLEETGNFYVDCYCSNLISADTFPAQLFFFKCRGISEQLPESLGQWEQRFRSLSDHGPIIVYLVSN